MAPIPASPSTVAHNSLTQEEYPDGWTNNDLHPLRSMARSDLKACHIDYNVFANASTGAN